MVVDRNWVNQLQAVIAKAAPAEQPRAARPAGRAHAPLQHPCHLAPVFSVVQTPRARAIREVTRIATWYGWQAELARALDAAGACSLHGLSREDLAALVTRMQLLEECVQHGGDPPDAPPAR